MKVLTIVILLSFFAAAQEKIESSFEYTADGRVLIHYEMKGDPDSEYSISIILKRQSDASFSHLPGSLSGDIGKGKFCCGQKTIIWTLTDAEGSLPDADDFYFQFTVNAISAPKKETIADNTDIKPVVAVEKSRWIYSLLVPGLGQILDKRSTGWVEAVAFVGAFAWSVTSKNSAQDKLDQYNNFYTGTYKTAPTAANKTQALKLKADADDSRKSFITTIFAVTAVYAASAVDAFFFHSDGSSLNQNLSTEIRRLPEGNYYGLNLRVGI